MWVIVRGLLDALLEASDLGGDIAFADAQNVGDLALWSFVQIQQQQGAIERSLLLDEALQQQKVVPVFVVAGIGAGNLVQLGIQWHGAQPQAHAVFAHMADRHVQSHPVHPRAEAARGVVAWPCVPQLGGDFLRQVVAIVGLPRIAVCDFEHDAAVLLQQRAEGLAWVILGVGGNGAWCSWRGEGACRTMIRTRAGILTPGTKKMSAFGRHPDLDSTCLHPLPGADFGGLAQFHHAIDTHRAAGYQLLAGTARVAQADQFQ